MHTAQPARSTPTLSTCESQRIYRALPRTHFHLDAQAFAYHEGAFCQWISAITETQSNSIATASETFAKMSLAFARNVECFRRFAYRTFGRTDVHFRTLELEYEQEIAKSAMLVEETLDVLAKKYGGLLHPELQHQLRTYDHFNPACMAWMGSNHLFEHLRQRYT